MHVHAEPHPGVLTAPPSAPDPAAHYLFYLHGAIIEEAGRRPRHPRYGIYEYDRVLLALHRAGAVVISERRPSGTQPAAYAARIAAQIRQLLARGVPVRNIAVVGFSKGGQIARHVSGLLPEPELRYVLLAACPGSGHASPELHGRVLAIRERSDSIPSCKRLFERSHLTQGREIEIAIGGEHGAFYRPHAAWLAPVLDFVR